MKSYCDTSVQFIWLFTLLIVGVSAMNNPASGMLLTSNLSIVNLGCGDIVSVYGLIPNGSLVLNYHSAGKHKNAEKCLWSLDTSKGGKRYSLKAKITLLISEPVNSGSALSAVALKSTTGNEWDLSNHELTSNAPIYKSMDWDYNLYLSYVSSKGSASGFLIMVTLLETCCTSPGSNFGFTDKSGTQPYGIARGFDKFSMTINPPEPVTTLIVDYFTSQKRITCSWADSLNIYEIRTTTCPSRLVRLCGNGNLTSPISFKSQYPLLATFYTSESRTVGTKFQISYT